MSVNSISGNKRGGALLSACRFFLLPLLFAAAAPAGAVVNQTFNYQGFLLNKNTNLPVETPQAVNFVIYGLASGGSPLFTENRCKVAVNKGRYDVEVGSVTAGGIPASIFVNNPNLWLEIQVSPSGACGGPYESMSPRMRLQASPYAFNSLYASTAAAATPVFSADIIGALPSTTNGAITISTNLFVLGGISVGSISPGQKLAVTGIVESKGTWPDCSLGANPTCGIKFADGSIQYKAAAVTMWEAAGDHVYSINPGNVAIGESNPNPLARLHVSTTAGDTGTIFLVTAGAVEKFKVNGLGEVYGGSFYGQGGTLNGVVRSTGDYMTGSLTLMPSATFTVTSPVGAAIPKLKFSDRVEISSFVPGNYMLNGVNTYIGGGVLISSHVYLATGSKYYGDGGGLTNLITNDSTKLWRTGDSMTGQLTIGYSTTTPFLGSTLTVTGNAFSVGGSTFSVLNGNTQVGGTAYRARFTVNNGGMVVTSSITAEQGFYAPNSVVNALTADFTGLTSKTANFTEAAPVDPDGDNYSITSASGIVVMDPEGKIKAAYFQGSGEMLTGVLKSTDVSKVSKFGDTMTGNLTVLGASVTITAAAPAAGDYSFTVANAPAPSDPTYYGLVVTRVDQNVGVQVNMPTAPLEVRQRARITSDADGPGSLGIRGDSVGYIDWSSSFAGGDGGGPQQGILGFSGGRDFIYRANALDFTTGAEVFRIAANSNPNYPYWKFGIGTSNPQEQFHVATNVQVSSVNAAVPTLFISTSTGRIGISTATASMTHNLTVGRGILAGSSVTAQGGFFGDGLGITRLSTSAVPTTIWVGSITARAGGLYDGVVFSTAVIMNSLASVGGEFTAENSDLHVKSIIRLQGKADGVPSVINFGNGNIASGMQYISWSDTGAKGALGMYVNESDLIYRAGDSDTQDNVDASEQAFRIKSNGRILIGGDSVTAAFPATEMLQVVGNMIVSNSNASASSIFLSPTAVGISTGAPKERLHVASSMMVGASDRAAAALFVSTQTGFTGVGTGYPQAMLSVGDDSETNSNILALGLYNGAGATPVTGAGTRLMWVPSMAALRAGNVTGSQWDGPGGYSVAFGQNNIASGTYSAALGGYAHTVHANSGVVAGGAENYVSGEKSAIPGGMYNIVQSSFAFAGGRKTHVSDLAEGTFAWGYSDTGGNGFFNNVPVTQPYSFIIDPSDVKHYKVGIRTPAPQTALDVNGDAQFGYGVSKSTMTAEGFWVPPSKTNAELQALHPAAGAMAFNSERTEICFFNGTVWVVVGTKTACE